MGSPHAPKKLTPTPAVDLRVDIHFLAQGMEETGGLFVGKMAQQPKQFPVDASGRGDYRRQEGVTQTVSLVSPAILVNLLLSSLQKLEVNVLMAQGFIQLGVISAAPEVMSEGGVNDDPTKPIPGQVADIIQVSDDVRTQRTQPWTYRNPAF